MTTKFNNEPTQAETLVAGQPYNTNRLEFAGWTLGDYTGSDGYQVKDYFSGPDSHGCRVFLGPDSHGIEPKFWVSA